jgi:hypothetical protein
MYRGLQSEFPNLKFGIIGRQAGRASLELERDRITADGTGKTKSLLCLAELE